MTSARTSASIDMEFKQTCTQRPDRLRRFAATLLLLCTASIAEAQVERPTDSQLADITARGRALAAYDFAAWHGSDAIGPLKPIPGTVTRYIARETPKGWVVAFGRLTAARDTFAPPRTENSKASRAYLTPSLSSIQAISFMPRELSTLPRSNSGWFGDRTTSPRCRRPPETGMSIFFPRRPLPASGRSAPTLAT